MRTASRPALRAPLTAMVATGHALGHLHDGEQAVEAVELGEGDGHADDGQRGHRGQHARAGGRHRRRRR